MFAALALALTGAGPVAAQAAPRYTAAQLHCARFAESSQSDIETASAGRTFRGRAEREAVWSFRARDTIGGIALEGWYDSLALRHGTGDTLIAPDTDGILGGRYRGVLEPAGAYTAAAVPFIPDEVAEATDAAAALDELFPRLPDRPLEPGETWRDGTAVEIERMADSGAGGRRLRRYALRRRTTRSETIPRGDTVPVPLEQTTVEEGRFVWDPATGLLRRVREIAVEALIPAGGRITRPVQTRVVQRSTLMRLEPDPACR